MGKILAIDHGTKRIGLAITDQLRIIASGLDTIPAAEIEHVLDGLFQKEEIDQVVVGLPLRLNAQDSDTTRRVREFVKYLQKRYPEMEVVTYDERFTSKIAQQTMIMAGAKKKQRREKGKLDMISATVLLQDYLAFIS